MKHIFNKKAVNISFNIIFYTMLVVLTLFALANMKVKNENNIANIFGYGFLSVQSNSMFGELDDSFEKGDMILVKMLSDQDKVNLQVGEIVTYYDLSIKAFNTHRIVEIDLDEGYVITKADYNPVTQQPNYNLDQPVALVDVISKYQSHTTNVGNVLDYMQTPSGFALTVILPVVIILVFEGFILFRNMMLVHKEKIEYQYKDDLKKTHELLEIEKEKMKKELMKELQKQENK